MLSQSFGYNKQLMRTAKEEERKKCIMATLKGFDNNTLTS